MFERFTASAIRVIMLAQEESRRMGFNHVGTEQILLGLIGEGNGIASRTLRLHGVNLKAGREAVEKLVGTAHESVAAEIPFTVRAKSLLEESWREAKSLGDNSINTGHLLLALSSTADGAGATVLETFSLSKNNLCCELLYQISEGDDDSLPFPWLFEGLSFVFGVFSGPELSKETSQLLQVCKSCCLAKSIHYIGSDQLLLAVLQDSVSKTSAALQGFGVDCNKVMNLVHCSKRCELNSDSKTAYTPKVTRIILGAKGDARSRKQRKTELENLILAMIDERSCSGNQILEKIGIDTKLLRVFLVEQIGLEGNPY